MGFLGSMKRFFTSFFGLAEGKTERLTDSMVTASADTIRSQFRKTKEDWNKDYQEMRSAIAELINIREGKMAEIKRLDNESDELQQKMDGAIVLYKQTPDERYKDAYTQMAEKRDQNEARVTELHAEVKEQSGAIDQYKSRLVQLQKQIADLNQEESQTIADIVSSQKIRELNDRLTGVSLDDASKNLEVVRRAREKSKSVAKLTMELSGQDKVDLETQFKAAGSKSKHGSAFDDAVGSSPMKRVTPEQLQSPSPHPLTADVESQTKA